MSKSKKPSRFFRQFSGEYMGNSFEIERRKMDKNAYKRLKKKLGRKPRSKIEYVYRDDDVGCRYLEKKHYINLIRNSEILYDEKKGKSIRAAYDWILKKKTKHKNKASKSGKRK